MKCASKLDAKEIHRVISESARVDVNGWIYIHVSGDAYARGFQNGYLLTSEIEDVVENLRLYVRQAYKRDWKFFCDTAMKLYWPKLTEEYQTEIEGVLAGIEARDRTALKLQDLLALNSYFDTVSYHYWLKTKEGQVQSPLGRGEHCSAFIATGNVTKDEKLLLAHNTWFSYITGIGYNVIVNVSPTDGNQFLMQAYPGTISSGTDWYMNSAGLVVAETTITGITTFNPEGVPCFMRARKAIQYADKLEEWAKIMIEGNNGGYASDWLLGDVKTKEIACLELGTFSYALDRTFNGIFTGSNVATSEKVRSETTLDYSDKSTCCTARRERWKQIVESSKERLDIETAKEYLADHYDAYTCLEKPGRNSLCGHIEQDPRGWPEWEWGPNYPAGSFDAKVTDSNLASVGTFWAHWGKPCNTDFNAESFLREHPEYNWQKPRLGSIKAYPWTLFSTYPRWTVKSI